MAPTDIPLSLLRRQIANATRVLVCAVVVVGTQSRLESDRWWCSPSIVSALTITKPQAAAIDRLYEEGLPTQQHTSEDEFGLMDDAVKRIRDSAYDDELLHVTERLATAQVKLCELRRRAFEQAVQVLTPLQRNKLARLIAEKRIAE